MDDLLRLLRENALETPANLAKMLNLTEEEVDAKIAEYARLGVIRGYQVVIDEEKLDIDTVQAVIEIKITPERKGGFNRIAARISAFPEVTSLFLMSGGYDLLAFIKGDNLREAAAFVSEKLATIDGVISTGTHFKLRAYKDQGFLMEMAEKNERLKVSP